MDVEDEQLRSDPPLDEGRDSFNRDNAEMGYHSTVPSPSTPYGASRTRGASAGADMSQNSNGGAQRSYVRSGQLLSDDQSNEAFTSLENRLLRLIFKSLAGVGAGCQIIAALMLAINPLNKSYQGIMFYIAMVLLLACVIAVLFEREEVNKAICSIMSFMTNEILLCIYLAANLLLSDWLFEDAVGKTSSGLLIISGIIVLGMAAVRIVAIFK